MPPKWNHTIARLSPRLCDYDQVESFIKRNPGATPSYIERHTWLSRGMISCIIHDLMQQRRIAAVPNMGPRGGKGYRVWGAPMPKKASEQTAWSFILDEPAKPEQVSNPDKTQVVIEMSRKELSLLVATLKALSLEERAAWSDSARRMWPESKEVASLAYAIQAVLDKSTQKGAL